MFNILAPILFGFSLTATTAPVIVNGTPITPAMVELELSQEPVLRQHGISSAAKMQKYRNDALQRLVERELLFPVAVKRGLAPSPKEIKARVDETADRMGGIENVRDSLARSDLDLKDYQNWIKKILAVVALESEVREDVNVSEDDAKSYFLENRDRYVQPRRAEAVMLFFKLAPLPSTEAVEQARARAVTASTVWRAGDVTAPTEIAADLDAEVRDLGVVHKGATIEVLDEVIFELKDGEVSDPVRSIYGWHVVKVLSQSPARALEFDDVKESLIEKLHEKRGEEALEELLSQARSKAVISTAP